MQDYTYYPGKQFINELTSRDQMTTDDARAWIESKTGYKYDPDAMYKLRWPAHEQSTTWSGYADLIVHIMYDHELATLDAEYRKANNLPTKKPWESWTHESAMGRADAAVRLDAPP